MKEDISGQEKELKKAVEKYYNTLIDIQKKRIDRKITSSNINFDEIDAVNVLEGDIIDIKDKYGLGKFKKDTHFFNTSDFEYEGGPLKDIKFNILYKDGIKETNFYKTYQKLKRTPPKQPQQEK